MLSPPLLQRERQVQKEETFELTEKLDKDWKSIQSLMANKTPKAQREDVQPEKPKVPAGGKSDQPYSVYEWYLSNSLQFCCMKAFLPIMVIV